MFRVSMMVSFLSLFFFKKKEKEIITFDAESSIPRLFPSTMIVEITGHVNRALFMIR